MGVTVTVPQKEEIETALNEVLASSGFRSSAQCQALLRYIVENSVTDHDEMLRERLIGIHVFRRSPGYDTGDDPVVRSRAAEVRKRLAQHYMNQVHSSGTLRIRIPSGSYRAFFESNADASPSRPPSPSANPMGRAENYSNDVQTEDASPSVDAELLSRSGAASVKMITTRKPWVPLVAIALIISTVATVFAVRLMLKSSPDKLFHTFWAPITGNRPTIISMGANHAYLLSDNFLRQYRQAHNVDGDSGVEFFVDLKKGSMLDEGDMLPQKGLIGVGDVAAATRLATMLDRLNLGYDLRYGDNLTVSDIKSTPTILIGGFSNPWSLRLMEQLPFRLTSGDQIIDTNNRNHSWKRRIESDTVRGDDYAIITRLMHPETGKFVVIIAGIDTYSNQAAADFLSNPEQLEPFLRKLPKGWEKRDMQIILHTTVVAGVPAVVNIEDVKSW